MRSTAHVKGHPLHPMLIPFPFAFLSGSFAFDLLGVWRAEQAWWTTGAYLAAAGILMAVVAAIPGVIDYLYTVPPNSSGKARATKHMTANLGAVALFACAWLWRGEASSRPEIGVLALELAGMALLGAGGWMGGTLVSRNQISIDHRYAGAGKWQEERFQAAKKTPVTVARRDDLEVDQMKLLHVNSRRIVLARTEKGYVAFDDRCTHKGGSLAGGSMMCGTVQCPWHGSQFDAKSGEVKAGPAEDKIRVYEVREEKGEVQLVL